MGIMIAQFLHKRLKKKINSDIHDEFLEDPNVIRLKRATKKAILKMVMSQSSDEDSSFINDLDEEEMKLENIESIRMALKKEAKIEKIENYMNGTCKLKTEKFLKKK